MDNQSQNNTNPSKLFSDRIKESCIALLNKTIASQHLSTKEAEIFLAGFEQYRLTGVTPHSTYLSMRRLYFYSSGTLPYYFRAVYGTCFPTRPFDQFSVKTIKQANVIADDGYLVLPKYFEGLEDLQTVVNQLESKSSKADPDSTMKTSKIALAEDDCLQSPLLNSILTDNYLMCIIEAYLGSKPIVDLVTAWRLRPLHVSHTQETLSQDALMFHVDLDRVMFLKLFVYLNEVGDDNGPHCYIPHSHLQNLPSNCRDDRRYSDQELRGLGLVASSIRGEAGTVIIGDTHCLHKGTPPNHGHRDIFQVEFTVSLFGANYSNQLLQKFPQGSRDQHCANQP